ncbi:uncharacterized protein [Coffea arabica]|uniref:Uncharacterized protein LOC113736825 n=1 Tax=Coffea arabica TaxID=13443 RepID=A0A6P6WWM7_COFAR|nr:uncharacterized protein LOC113736825 [Coffea arabica]
MEKPWGAAEYNPASTALVKHHIEEIQIHLKSLRSFFENVSELDIEEHPELEDLVDQVTDSAYKVENVVDSFEVDGQWQDFFWLDNVLEEFRLLSMKARGIRLTTPDAEVQASKKVTQYIFERLSRNSTPAIQEIVVDLSNREKETKKKSFEDAAKDFLMDLIDRSLVIISRRRSNSRVRACPLHDLVLDFCKSKTQDRTSFS